MEQAREALKKLNVLPKIPPDSAWFRRVGRHPAALKSAVVGTSRKLRFSSPSGTLLVTLPVPTHPQY
jgi:hypothetical protein